MTASGYERRSLYGLMSLLRSDTVIGVYLSSAHTHHLIA